VAGKTLSRSRTNSILARVSQKGAPAKGETSKD
jgi:hypothetical protein